MLIDERIHGIEIGEGDFGAAKGQEVEEGRLLPARASRKLGSERRLRTPEKSGGWAHGETYKEVPVILADSANRIGRGQQPRGVCLKRNRRAVEQDVGEGEVIGNTEARCTILPV
jgi:hypothetical protein